MPNSAYAMLTFSPTPDYTPLGDLTYPNKQQYCDRYGIDLVAIPHSVPWTRLAKIKELLAVYEHVFFVDTDAIIMNHRFDVRVDCWEIRHGITVQADCNGLNTGVMLWHRNPDTMAFLHACLGIGRDFYGDHPWGEQEAMTRFLAMPPYSHGFARWVKQRYMNSYVCDAYGPAFPRQGNYEPGDWIIHMPGLSFERRMELTQRYLSEAIQ